MSLPHSRFALASCVFISISLFLVPDRSLQAAQDDSTRITSSANVTLRAMPAADAAVVAQLPLGTELTDAGPAGLDKTWVRVRLADNREGWLLSNMTKPLDPVWRWPTFDRIIAERLGRKGDAFPAAAELVAFIERVAPEYTDADGRGRVELSRLRAMSSALSAIPFRGERRDPYLSWLTAHKTQVVYDEPGGRWMLLNTHIWDLHTKHSATTSADEIAWFAVSNGVAGECEGEVACYLRVENLSLGEYLRRHPLGKHAGEAVGKIKGLADLLIVPVRSNAAYEFNKTRDCRDVTSSVDALIAAVQGTRVQDRDAAIASLAALKKMCQ